MKILIVEDDFASRYLMQTILKKYGPCDVATNGIEAVMMFNMSISEGDKYDLICLDINMPEMDGKETLKQIRYIESQNGIEGLDGTKIIMTTAYGDSENVIFSFTNQCDAYLIKPIVAEKLHDIITDLCIE